jgi:hypothetical protein
MKPNSDNRNMLLQIKFSTNHWANLLVALSSPHDSLDAQSNY